MNSILIPLSLPLGFWLSIGAWTAIAVVLVCAGIILTIREERNSVKD
ncbi:MAG: hypothetical protein MK009_03140 [Gammaproteobacteria bacterium]|nr:hypothetical protein [Gammaproteobacteria bacterium]